MTLKSPYRVSLIIVFATLLTGQSCTGRAIQATTEPAMLIVTSTREATKSATPMLTSISTLSPVPPNVFVLLFYPPLIINYDTAIWKDESNYRDGNFMVNYLQALNLETCQIGVIGPSGNFPYPDEFVQLGGVRYQIAIFEDITPGLITAYYIEDQSLAGFDYEMGVPVLTVQSNPSEWSECKTLTEAVLSTLHSP
jgi:hypothetical protein